MSITCIYHEVLGVVAEAVASQVPAPGLAVGAHQRRVAHRVQRRLLRGHAHHGVRAALARRPVDAPGVEAPCVAHAAPDAVCALGHRVAMEGEAVLVLFGVVLI